MTELDIASYCHDCPHICPSAQVTKIEHFGSFTPSYRVRIVCENWPRCREIHNHIKEQIKEMKP